MPEQRDVTLICTAAAFRRCQPHPVRWLDVERDYELARAYWATPLAREDWEQFGRDGYEYAAAIEDGRIVALAAAWRYSDTAWEVAGVGTVAEARRRGHGKSVVSFVTEHIVASGRTATCHTRADNVPMQRTAESVGFRRDHDEDR